MSDEDVLVNSQDPEGAASALKLDDALWGAGSPEDVAAFQDRFLRLLERRTALYTMGESTSVPRHVAADILRSVCFVLGIDPDRPTVPERLLSADLEAELRRGLAEIERKVAMSAELWAMAAALMPAIPSTSLHDTMASIGDFPKLYEFRSMAHEIPCVFDYPLCHPVADELLGVDYINEYLRRLITELEFLQRFEPAACMYVLERSSPDYVELLVNLYEPVAANAIGRALIGCDPLPLRISEQERERVVGELAALGRPGRLRTLRHAASAVADALGIDADRDREYLAAFAEELLERVEVGLAPDELRGVFV